MNNNKSKRSADKAGRQFGEVTWLDIDATWRSILKNLPHHPYSQSVPLKSGVSLEPLPYTRMQKSFLDLVEAARHLHQAGRCLLWSLRGVLNALAAHTTLRGHHCELPERIRKEGCNASYSSEMANAGAEQPGVENPNA